MWFSQNLPLSPAWISVHAPEGAYIGPIYHPWGLNVFSVLRLWQVPLTKGCSFSGGSRIWRKGGARGFGSLPPRFFGYILANLEDFLKNLAKIGGCYDRVSLILPIYVRTVALRRAWRAFYVPAGGGGVRAHPTHPPSLRPCHKPHLSVILVFLILDMHLWN